MENLFGAQIYVPGQIWKLKLEMSYANDIKARPYLVVGSTRRKVILLKLTHGGEFSSNWIYPLQHPNGSVSRIILDAPIVISTDEVESMYMYTLSRELFKDIYKEYISAQIYLSGINAEVLTLDFMNDVRSIIDNHEETMASFARYGNMRRADEGSNDKKEDDDVDAVVEPVETGEIPESATEDINEELDDVVETEEINEVSEEVPAEEYIPEPAVPSRVKYSAKETIKKVSDIVVFGTSCFTTAKDMDKMCNEFGIKHYKFQLNDLLSNKAISYSNNTYYGISLKCSINRDYDHPRKRRDLIAYKDMVMSDVERFGVIKTAHIWGTHCSNLYKTIKKWDGMKGDIAV